MNMLADKLTKSQIDLSVELRLANGSSAGFYESDKERVHEALRLLGAPRLFAQAHLLLASPHWASIIPCKGIDMILVRTSAPLPLKFPVEIPAGLFDIVEQPDDWPDNKSAAFVDQIGQPRRRQSQVEIHAIGGWTVTLAAVAMFLGNAQDERQFFSQLPNMPTIPFRLKEDGFGLINTANILRVSVWPKPETLPGSVLPFARTDGLRRANAAAGTRMLRR
jgi:hypothetical protein